MHESDSSLWSHDDVRARVEGGQARMAVATPSSIGRRHQSSPEGPPLSAVASCSCQTAHGDETVAERLPGPNIKKTKVVVPKLSSTMASKTGPLSLVNLSQNLC